MPQRKPKLGGIDAEEPRGKAGRALLLAVDRLALNDDGAQQHAQRLRMGDRAAAVDGGDVLLEQLEHPHACEEVIDQGKWPQTLGTYAQRRG
jgi:hypothetical protein